MGARWTLAVVLGFGLAQACDPSDAKKRARGSEAGEGGAAAATAAPVDGGAPAGDAGSSTSLEPDAGAGAVDTGEGGAAGAPLVPIAGAPGNPGAGGGGEDDCGVLTFVDPNLDAVVRTTVGSPEGAFQVEDVEQLTTLDASSWDIVSLEGIQCWANLRSIRLTANAVTDVSPLVALPKLAELYIDSNGLSDIARLTELPTLQLLYINDNPIADFQPLAQMSGLTHLYVYGTGISDLSPLSGLQDLVEMDLGGNPFTSLDPLVANPGIDDGDRVFVSLSAEDCLAQATNIAALRDRGVLVMGCAE